MRTGQSFDRLLFLYSESADVRSARRVETVVSKADTAYGGEFLLLLPDTAATTALRHVRSLRVHAIDR